MLYFIFYLLNLYSSLYRLCILFKYNSVHYIEFVFINLFMYKMKRMIQHIRCFNRTQQRSKGSFLKNLIFCWMFTFTILMVEFTKHTWRVVNFQFYDFSILLLFHTWPNKPVTYVVVGSTNNEKKDKSNGAKLI